MDIVKKSNIDVRYDVIITTFLRPNKLQKCLETLSKLSILPNKVVIADQTSISPFVSSKYPALAKYLERIIKKYEEIYQKYANSLDLEVVRLDFDAGLSKSRNAAFKQTSAPLVFVIDDDIYLPYNAPEIVEILVENSVIGGVALLLKEVKDGIVCTAGDIKYSNGHVVISVELENKKICKTSSGIRYMIFDHIPNCTLFKRECLNDYTWDEAFKISEHEDFYLTHKKLNKWKFAVSFDHVAIHDHRTNENPLYILLRWRHENIIKSYEYLIRKHKIKSFVVESVYLTRYTGLKDKMYRLLLFKLLPRSFYWHLYLKWLLPYRINRKVYHLLKRGHTKIDNS